MTQKTISQRLRIDIHGAVQGVGFRPFVYQCATAKDLKGWVRNESCGVIIEVEGSKAALDQFLIDLQEKKPAIASIHSLKYALFDAVNYQTFEILESAQTSEVSTLILPDIATCSDCLKEIYDQENRRFAYPFTNCTHCGPRYSIIESIPYDRKSTTMKLFEMCDACRIEYEDPNDRRFHAQPNACSNCGPRLELWDEHGEVLNEKKAALSAAVDAIRSGQIVAVKGLGGFHLMVDANNVEAIEKLRLRKHREEKPFAVMFPSLAQVKLCCDVSAIEGRLLTSLEAPIVLLKKKKDVDRSFVAAVVAIDNPYLGVMLPYTPLHHLLIGELNIAVVATSANITDEPMCINENEALIRLKGIADVFLMHNRPIVRHVDDSIVRVMAGRPLVLRRARGFAPLPIHLNSEVPSVLAVGGHLKDTIALSVKDNVFISQHLGDLETNTAMNAFEDTIKSFKNFYDADIKMIVTDLHPEYLSTKSVEDMEGKQVAVQHHHAHIVSCMAENKLEGDVLGIAWDGTGYGSDQTIWGGEFLKGNLSSYERFAHFSCFPLPGGEKAVKEPRRSALGLLYACYGAECFTFDDLPTLQAFSKEELSNIKTMLHKNVNVPLTSSVGRLFDAVASFLDLKQIINFEGQAAMGLEFIADQSCCEFYAYEIEEGSCLVINVKALVSQILEDVRLKKDVVKIAAKFHNTLLEIAVDVAKKSGLNRIVLSGGCFQNKILTEGLVARLPDVGLTPYWHQNIPPNDGGISLGQVVVAANQ